ncbi:MAG: 4Fe-4S ferredoxin [Gemmatimonadetes bacterium]|nr:4Fe-4S ferredoxin [Gemmatimonadota bacterium]
MNYGFVIDNRACIGCHACSTACKSENGVPLGVYRTWVSYTETGRFPDTGRHFQVTRCNHCANPPCVRICPVAAMIRRHDGIVEFDGERCIGCKACLQACPYDAVYIDPETGTAAKCHYCAHRTDLGREPACVVICPEHAILAGDLEDPSSEIARFVARESVTVRKPEQGTAPQLFYRDGHAASLHPTSSLEGGGLLAFAESSTSRISRLDNGAGEPIARRSYDVDHHVPWQWPVPAYLVTKAAGTGVFGVLALAILGGWINPSAALVAVAGLAGLFLTAITALLLTIDLERPERCFFVLIHPQWSSWLTRGAYLLLGFGVVAGIWWISEVAAWVDWIDGAPRLWLAAFTLPCAAGASIYTAFLFAQAEGRDLWQSPLLPGHLVLRSAMMGSGLLLLIEALMGAQTEVARGIYLFSSVASLFALLVGDLAVPHTSEVGARAADEIRRGRYRWYYWCGGAVAGHLIPMTLVLLGDPDLSYLAVGLAAGGLYAFEYAFVMAPQEIPNS